MANKLLRFCTVRLTEEKKNILTDSLSDLPLLEFWRPDVSANNLANVLLKLGRTMGILALLFFFFSGCDFMLAPCLSVVCQNLLHIDRADGLEGSARSFL